MLTHGREFVFGLLHCFEQLWTVSFHRISNMKYPQDPHETDTEESHRESFTNPDFFNHAIRHRHHETHSLFLNNSTVSVLVKLLRHASSLHRVRFVLVSLTRRPSESSIQTLSTWIPVLRRFFKCPVYLMLECEWNVCVCKVRWRSIFHNFPLLHSLFYTFVFTEWKHETIIEANKPTAMLVMATALIPRCLQLQGVHIFTVQ